MKDNIKIVLFVLAVIGFGAWYYLEGTDTPDPKVYTEASETLKTIDATVAETKECYALLNEEERYLKFWLNPALDPTVSAQVVATEQRKHNAMIALNNEHKKECEPKITAYEANLVKYKTLYKEIENAKKARIIKILEKKNPPKEENTFVFDLKYDLKYAAKSERFKVPK